MCNFHFILLIMYYLCVSVQSQNYSMSIPLDANTTKDNREMFGQFVEINRSSTLQVNFSQIKENISFVIFQAHSQFYNVTMYTNSMAKNSSTTGTNVGMYSEVKPLTDTFYIYNPNEDVDLKIYISVHGYDMKDPIPGGCNIVYPIPTFPGMIIWNFKDYLYVDTAPARGNLSTECNDLKKLYVEFYRLYLPERSFDAENYFEGIRNMITLDKIWKYGEYIPTTSQWHMRRILSAYPGTGAVYVAVAVRYEANGSEPYYSVYVPTVTYSCSPLEDYCQLLDDFLSQILCALLLFIGLFMCYFGHRFFKTEMFLIGLVSGILLTYTVISQNREWERSALVGVSLLSGLFFGAIWLLVWWLYGIPVVSVLLSTLNFGFLVSAILFFIFTDYSPIFIEDSNYWSLFIVLMLFTSFTLLSVTLLSNILCCAVLGAYAVVYPIDYYIGTSLKYVIINVIRRAVVPKFNIAVISPPFGWKEIILILVWLFLSITGFLFQHYHNRGKPPFPPPPRSTRYVGPENTVYGAVNNRELRYGTDVANRLTASQVVRPRTDERTPLLS